MRVVGLLVLAALLGSCSHPPQVQSVKKYCVLASMPHTTAAQLYAMHNRAITLFKQRNPYHPTAVNQRVVAAATGLTQISELAALQLEHPRSLPEPKGVGLAAALRELTAACAALPAT